MKLLWLIVLIVGFELPGMLRAETTPACRWIYRIVSAEQDPQHPELIVEAKDLKVLMLAAASASIAKAGGGAEDRKYLIGACLSGIEVNRVGAKFSDQNGNTRLALLESWSGGLDSQPVPTVSEIRSSLIARKGELKQLNQEIQDQAETIGRLKRDAELVGDGQRLTQVEREILELQTKSAGLRRDAETLQRFLTLGSNEPEPRNFAKRMNDLTRQTAELASAAKDAEARAQQAQNATVDTSQY